VIQQTSTSVLLRFVPAKGYSGQVGQKIISILKQRGAGDLNFTVELVSEIPLTSNGKRRFITSRLQQDPFVSKDTQSVS
jgi:hypothetical protein